MRTVRQLSPFDDPQRQEALATPTCCSCCCCLVTLITSTTLVAVHASSTPRARRAGAWARVGLGLAAVIGLLVALSGLQNTVDGFRSGWEHNLTGPANLTLGLTMLWLGRSGAQLTQVRDLAWSALVVVIAAAAFVVELRTAGFLFIGQVLAIPLPIIGGIALHQWMKHRP